MSTFPKAPRFLNDSLQQRTPRTPLPGTHQTTTPPNPACKSHSPRTPKQEPLEMYRSYSSAGHTPHPRKTLGNNLDRDDVCFAVDYGLMVDSVEVYFGVEAQDCVEGGVG